MLLGEPATRHTPLRHRAPSPRSGMRFSSTQPNVTVARCSRVLSISDGGLTYAVETA
ncbi:hypothetical protein LQK93_00032 [Terrabacter sp. BE26]